MISAGIRPKVVASGMQREAVMTPCSNRPSAPAGLRRVAVLTALAFGCTTVRAPVSAIPPEVPIRGGAAEPQLELWLESGEQVSPVESAKASAEAKAALEAAVANAPAPQGDTLLVVRAQGVARTASRRTDQKAAVVGIVVGAVVVVAAVIVLIATSKGGKGGGGPKVARGAPARGPSVRPAPRPVPPPVFLPRPARGRPHVGVAVGVAVGGEAPPPPGAAPMHYVVEPPHPHDPLAAPPGPAEAAELAAVSLPPPRPLDLEERGYFAGDLLRLELAVVDRGTGAAIWTKEVEGEVDPRDAAAVERLLTAALADGKGWVPAGAHAGP